MVASGTVSINNATRVGDISGTPDFYKLDPIDYPLVSLVTYGDIYHDEILVRFIQGTTAGFDRNWDAMKLFSIDPDVPQISIHYGKQAFALNTLPEIYNDLEIDIHFRCAQDGMYEIRVDERTNLDPGVQLYLKDNLEQKTISLTKGSTYSFYHQSENEHNRFKLYFNPNEDIINNIGIEDWFTVFSHDNNIRIIKNTINTVKGKICISDMLGRVVYQDMLSNNEESTLHLNLPSGYYIISLLTDQHTTTSKVYIGKP
jgi:hypothetical protein